MTRHELQVQTSDIGYRKPLHADLDLVDRLADLVIHGLQWFCLGVVLFCVVRMVTL
jgi:hypothetical protein